MGSGSVNPSSNSVSGNPKISEESFYDALKQNPLLSDLIMGKEGKALRTLAESVAETSAIRIVKNGLIKLGYQAGDLDYPGIDATALHQFQLLCGIYDGKNGTLIGKKTLLALIKASRAGDKWKKEVAGLNDKLSTPNLPAVKTALAKLKNVKVEYSGLHLTFSKGNPVYQVVIDAYIALGFDLRNENGSINDAKFIAANYKFQILSGANTESSRATNYGPLTHKNLVKALVEIEKGRDWREAF